MSRLNRPTPGPWGFTEGGAPYVRKGDPLPDPQFGPNGAFHPVGGCGCCGSPWINSAIEDAWGEAQRAALNAKAEPLDRPTEALEAERAANARMMTEGRRFLDWAEAVIRAHRKSSPLEALMQQGEDIVRAITLEGVSNEEIAP